MESIKKLKIYLIKNRSIFINNQKHKHIAKIDLTASNLLTSKKKKKNEKKTAKHLFIPISMFWPIVNETSNLNVLFIYFVDFHLFI